MTHIHFTSTKVSHKGQVVLPVTLRLQRYFQRENVANLALKENEHSHIMLSFEDPIEAAYGMLAGGPDFTRLVVEEHARERERERAKIRA